MIGRADIEGSTSDVATNAWLSQAIYPCGNFSDTSGWTSFKHQGSIGHVFTVCIRTENHNHASISPLGHHGISAQCDKWNDKKSSSIPRSQSSHFTTPPEPLGTMVSFVNKNQVGQEPVGAGFPNKWQTSTYLNLEPGPRGWRKPWFSVGS